MLQKMCFHQKEHSPSVLNLMCCFSTWTWWSLRSLVADTRSESDAPATAPIFHWTNNVLAKQDLHLTKEFAIEKKMTTGTKHCVFSVFFNCDRRGKAGAERAREESIAHLKRLFENVARFARVAKGENDNEPSLTLKGHVDLNSPCTQPHMKRWLGKSMCCPSNFGDTVNLCRLVCVDKELTTIGELSKAGNSNAEFATKPKFVVRLLVDSMEGRE